MNRNPVRSSRLIVGVMACLLLITIGTPAQATFPGTNGHIALHEFEGSQDPLMGEGLYVMNRDGINVHRITSDLGDRDPSWSADGSMIAFSRCTAGQCDIWIITDGVEAQVTNTPNKSESHPAWSPGGAVLAFARCPLGSTIGCGIYKHTLALGINDRIAKDAAEPAWSPKGHSIAFDRLTPGGKYSRVFIMARDGSNKHQLTNVKGAHEADWSPDARELVAVSADRKLFTVNRDGTGLKWLRTKFSLDYSPVFSPSGRKVLYVSAQGDNEAAIRLDLKTNAQRILTRCIDCGTSSVSWQAR